MRRNGYCGLPLAALPLLGSLVLGADSDGSAPGNLFQSVRMGEVWYGPKVSVEDLKGRVVLIDFWGIN